MAHTSNTDKQAGLRAGLIGSLWLRLSRFSCLSPPHTVGPAPGTGWLLRFQTLGPPSTVSRGREKDASQIHSQKNEEASFPQTPRKAFFAFPWFKHWVMPISTLLPGQFSCSDWCSLLIPYDSRDKHMG